MTDMITPALKNEFESELRDIQGYLSIIQGADESIKEITVESKEKYGISAGEMRGIAKKMLEDKLSEGIEKTTNVLTWMEVAKEA